VYSTQSSPYCTAYGSLRGELGYSERSQLSVSHETRKRKIKSNDLTFFKRSKIIPIKRYLN
tara:strand:+ start:153 stop:335 length:183 start_codon:yes stop_codon:yes gene_type:complete